MGEKHTNKRKFWDYSCPNCGKNILQVRWKKWVI